MRFPLELRFIDLDGRTVSTRPLVPPRRFAFARHAHAVVERPAGSGL
jgi:uncharacterized membrane protein (UPF0127 family)